jgi:hypothetical protein
LTLTVTVAAGPPGGGTPTGSATIYDGKKRLGTVSLKGGVATLTSRKWKLGKHAITVIYHGDADFNGSTSAKLPEVVKKAAKGKKAKVKARLAVPAARDVGDGTPHASNGPVPSMRLRDLALESVLGEGPKSARLMIRDIP